MKYIGSERDLMRQGQQNRRGRGRNNGHNQNQGQSFNQGPNPNSNPNANNNQNRKPQNQLSKNYESSGPDVKIRGTAHHIAEKYTHLARDAASAGDFIVAENYLQHAEHYNRLIMAAQPTPIQHIPNAQPPQPYIHSGEQPNVTGNGNRLQIENRNVEPASQIGASQDEDSLPGFLTQPVQIPDAAPIRRERPERAERRVRVDRPEAPERVEHAERAVRPEQDETAVRARRRRRPTNGPEVLTADKTNGHAVDDGAAPASVEPTSDDN
ncbi:MAG: DUF4167 domain-containing protein [Hyphomicrobiales bacterium]|nr:DUF4167 domain-containing protein [Hyphomicrobiales bacterium]